MEDDESFLKIDKIDENLPLVFQSLLDDKAEGTCSKYDRPLRDVLLKEAYLLHIVDS